jgi:hypothetical protein
MTPKQSEFKVNEESEKDFDKVYCECCEENVFI